MIILPLSLKQAYLHVSIILLFIIVRNNTEMSTSELIMNTRILDHPVPLGIKVNPQHNPPM